MRIGLVNEYFPPFAPGGAEWSNLALAKGLAQGHNVRVITPDYGAQALEEKDGFRVERFPSPVKLDGQNMTVSMRHLASPGFSRRLSRAIRDSARQQPLDIIHVQAKYSLPGAYRAARHLRIPIVYTVRDSLVICPTGQCLMEHDPVHPQCGRFLHWWRECRPPFMARYIARNNTTRVTLALLWQQAHVRRLRGVMKRVDGVIGVSQGILEVYRQAGLTLGKDTAVIYNLPPLHSFPGQERIAAMKEKYQLGMRPVVLYAGKYSPGKGTQILVEAADQVKTAVPDVLFLFAGHGELQLKGPHTQDLGRLPHEDLLALYRLAELVVIPSTWHEPLSRVGLEAMAAGRPLVGTRIGGTPEQIEDGVNGCLVPRKNPLAMAEAIIKILKDEKLRHSMGAASRRMVEERFSPEASLRQTVDFYQKLIDARAGRKWQ